MSLPNDPSTIIDPDSLRNLFDKFTISKEEEERCKRDPQFQKIDEWLNTLLLSLSPEIVNSPEQKLPSGKKDVPKQEDVTMSDAQSVQPKVKTDVKVNAGLGSGSSSSASLGASFGSGPNSHVKQVGQKVSHPVKVMLKAIRHVKQGSGSNPQTNVATPSIS